MSEGNPGPSEAAASPFGRPRPEPRGVKPLPTRSLPSNALHTFSIRRGEKHAAHHRDAFCQRLSAEDSRTLMNKGG